MRFVNILLVSVLVGTFWVAKVSCLCGNVVLEQTLKESKASGSEYSIVLRNEGSQVITDVVISTNNGEFITNLWPFQYLGKGKYSFPEWLNNVGLVTGGVVKLGYFTSSVKPSDFVVEKVICSSENYNAPEPFSTKVFSASTDYMSSPSLSVSVPAGYKLVGGGAQVLETNAGTAGAHLLVSYPSDTSTWTVQYGHHTAETQSKIKVFAVGIFDPDNLLEVGIFSEFLSADNESFVSHHVSVPSGFTMTSGGVRSSSFVICSFPADDNDWQAVVASDPLRGSPVDDLELSVYALGLRFKENSGYALHNHVFSKQTFATFIGEEASDATVASSRYTMTGGGAQGFGAVLSEMYPLDDITWRVSGYITSSGASIQTLTVAIAIQKIPLTQITYNAV